MLGDCLMAWRGEVDESFEQHIDARAAAIRIAEFMNLVCSALKPKG